MSHPEDVSHPTVPLSLLPMYNADVGCVAGYLRKKPSTKHTSYWNSMKWPKKWVWIPIDIHGSQNYQLFFLESSWTETTKIHRVYHLVGALLERIGDTLFVLRIPNDEDLFFQTETIGEANRWVATLTQLIRAANQRSDSLSKAYMDLVNTSLDSSLEAIRTRSESTTWWNSLSGSFASHADEDESNPDAEDVAKQPQQAVHGDDSDTSMGESIKQAEESLQTLLRSCTPEETIAEAGNIVEEATSCASEIGGVTDPMLSTISEMLGSVLQETEMPEKLRKMNEDHSSEVSREDEEHRASSAVPEAPVFNGDYAEGSEDSDERHMTETVPLLEEYQHNAETTGDRGDIGHIHEETGEPFDQDVVGLCNHLVFEGAVSGGDRKLERFSDQAPMPSVEDAESASVRDPSFIQTVLDDVADGVVGSEEGHEDDTGEDELNEDGQRAPFSTPIHPNSEKGANEVMDLEDLPFYLPSARNREDLPGENTQAKTDDRSVSTESVDGSPTRETSLLPTTNTSGGEMNADGSYVIVSPTAGGLSVQSRIGPEPDETKEEFKSIAYCGACDPNTPVFDRGEIEDHSDTAPQAASVNSVDTGDLAPLYPFISSMMETNGGQGLLMVLGMIVQMIGWSMVRTVWITLVVWRVLCVVVFHSATAFQWRLCVVLDFISTLYRKCTDMLMTKKK